MPFYLYRCPKCKEIKEIYRPVKHNIPACNKCGVKMKRVFTAPGLVFKGLDFPSHDLKVYKEYERRKKKNEI